MGPVSVTPQLYVFNVLNRQGVTDVVEDFNPDGTFCLETAGCGADILGQRNFERLGTVPYGQPIPQEGWAKPSARQDPRQIRAALKISF
jgi:hypothetical protein